VYDRILCVPIFNELTDAQVDEVAGHVARHFRGTPGA